MERASPWRGFLNALAVLAALLGVASGAGALVAFAAGWALLVGLSFLAARRGLQGVEVARHLPASAFENDLLTVDLAVENHAAAPARFLVAGDVFGAGLSDRQSVLEPGPLPPMHRRLLSYRAFVARQWGLYTVGPLSIGAFDPLGLFFARREVARLHPFEVYPRAVEIEALAARGGRATVAPRDVTANAAGRSALFRGVREFNPGDDVRRIHWPATARRGIPMVREFERDLEPLFAVFLDLARRGRAGLGRKSTLEYLVRVAASLLWTAHRRGDSISLFAESDRPVTVPAGRGEAHLAAALHELVVARQSGDEPLLDVVGRHREILPPGSTAALLLSTTEIDLQRFSRTMGELRAGSVRPLALVVDALTFTQVDRPAVPAEAARSARSRLESEAVRLDVPLAVLGVDEAPEDAVQRPDLFTRREEATA